VISTPVRSSRTEPSGLDPVCNARDTICGLGYKPLPGARAPTPSARQVVAPTELAAPSEGSGARAIQLGVDTGSLLPTDLR
jgi:hypothetical protein